MIIKIGSYNNKKRIFSEIKCSNGTVHYIATFLHREVRRIKRNSLRRDEFVQNFVGKPTRGCGILCKCVGIETDFGLDDRRVGVRVPVGSRIFSSPLVLGLT
jgi:hypothetical protein